MTGQAAAHIEKLKLMEGRLRSEAARELGLCEAYVTKLAKDNGISLAKNPPLYLAIIARLKELASCGFTRSEAAAELSISQSYIAKLCGDANIKFIRSGLKLVPDMRVQQMAALYRSGRTLNEIGGEFGITRERVRQLIRKFYGIRATDGGSSKKAAERRVKFEARRNSASLRKWGCNWDQYVALRDMKKPTRAFAQQKRNASSRGIAWDLNLWQWWSIWQQSGKWSQRGRGQGYMMCRVGDTGGYSVGNVFIATGCENSSEQARKKSGLPRGVVKRNSSSYTAYRMFNGQKYHVGSFPTPELAHAAYLAFTAPMEIAA